MSYILDNDATYVATRPYVEPIPVPEEIVEAAKLHGVTPAEYLEARERVAEEAARMPVITAGRELTPEERVISEENLERLRKQEKDAQRHAEYMYAKEVTDNVMGTGLSLLAPSTYINNAANVLGVTPLNFGESLAVDFLTPGIFGALGKAGKVGKLSKLADRVAEGAVDVVPLLDRSTTVGGRFGRYGSNLPSDVIRTGKGASKIVKKVSPAELARLTEEESAIAENVMKAYKVPGYDRETSHQMFLRYDNEPSPTKKIRYLDLYDDYNREGARIQKNYENAMTRRRDYIYGGVGNTVMYDQSPVFIGPDKKSLLIAAGQNNAKPGELKMITHFAPETLRGGAETVKEALYAQDPIGFAVTDDLAPMLEKIGYIKVGNVPQYFNGELVNKTVFVNKATTEKTVNDWLLKNHYIDEPIKIESLQYNISDDSPKLHTYSIKDLIKPLPDKSGAAAAELPASFDIKSDPYRDKWPLVKSIDRTGDERYSSYEWEYFMPFFDHYNHQFFSKNLKDFTPTITKYAKTLPPLSDSSEFIPNDFYHYFVNYYRNLGYDIYNANPEDVIKIIEDNYKQLKKGATGELAGRVMWHASPARYVLHRNPRQLQKVEEAAPDQFVFNPKRKWATSLTDVPGIYFGVQPFTAYSIPMMYEPYGGSIGVVRMDGAGIDMQPYLINGIKGFYHDRLPDRFEGVIPKNTALYTDRFKGNKACQYAMPDESEITVPFGTSIKSLYPHPNAFVTNSDGTITLQRDWGNPNLHYKSGGSLQRAKYNKSNYSR